MPCFYCESPLAWAITAGNPASRRQDEYRAVGTCSRADHVDRGRRWASLAGTPNVEPADDGPTQTQHDNQPALFDLPRSHT